MSRLPLALALVGLLATGGPADAADRLLSVAALNDQQVLIVSDASARAFDRIQAARRAIAERRAFDASQELARARGFVRQARGASPAFDIQQRIDSILAHLDDPTRSAPRSVLDPVFAALDGAGDPAAFAATRRYVERARYELFRGDRDAAIHELASASARVPYTRMDAPLALVSERVDHAQIQLFAGRIEAADASLAEAERQAHDVVRLASGLDVEHLTDVAAPPPAPAAEKPAPIETEWAAPTPTESVIPTAPEFLETSEPPLADGEAPAPVE